MYTATLTLKRDTVLISNPYSVRAALGIEKKSLEMQAQPMGAPAISKPAKRRSDNASAKHPTVLPTTLTALDLILTPFLGNKL